MRKNRQIRTYDVRFMARSDSEEKRVEGYFAVFGPEYVLWEGASESVDPHAFDGALGGDIRALIDHDTRLVLGRTTAGTLELRADEKGLFGSILINPDDQDAMNLYARVARGDVSQCSFGFDILDEEYTHRDDGTDHWLIKSVKLYEVSVCTFPAYQDTAVQARKAELADMNKRKLEAWRQRMLARIKAKE